MFLCSLIKKKSERTRYSLTFLLYYIQKYSMYSKRAHIFNYMAIKMLTCFMLFDYNAEFV